MNSHKSMLIINLVGGLAVLASYAWCILGFPETAGQAWGGIPLELKPLYTNSMFAAAAGYFPFTAYLLLQVQPDKLDRDGPFPFSWINWLYLVILLPSALWMPLTMGMIETPNASSWFLIRLVLAVTALGSLGMLYAVLRLRRLGHPIFFWLALIGITVFNFQTTVLDAVVWTLHYPYP